MDLLGETHSALTEVFLGMYLKKKLQCIRTCVLVNIKVLRSNTMYGVLDQGIGSSIFISGFDPQQHTVNRNVL